MGTESYSLECLKVYSEFAFVSIMVKKSVMDNFTINIHTYRNERLE